MKHRFLFPLFCLLAMFACFSCSDDDENKGGSSYLDLNKQVLTLTEGDVTTSTFTFSVEASDATIPYLCLYVDKAIIDKVPKGELPAYLMDDLKKQAEADKKTFEEYIASISLTGNQENLQLNNLLPGRLYELVAFAVDGTRPAEQAEFLFFETQLAETVDCSFNIKVAPTAGGAVFEVKPSNKDVDYYLCSFPKASYDQMINSGEWDDAQIVSAYFGEDMNRLLAQLAPDGIITQEVVDMLLQTIFHKGDVQLQVSGAQGGVEYIWLAAAFKVVEVDNTLNFAIVSTPEKGTYVPEKAPMKDVTFDIQVTDVTATSANIVVTPSDLEQKYIWCYDPYDESTQDKTPMEIAEQFVRAQGPFINFVVKTGVQTAPGATLTPGVKHYVVAFAYENGIVSEPQRYEFTALPSGADPAEMTFAHTINSVSPYQVNFDLIPSDETLPYAFVVMPDEDFNEAEVKQSVEAGVQAEYENSLRFDPQKPMSTFLYESYYRPGSRYYTVYNNLTPNKSYTLCSLSLNNEGKVARVQTDKAFAVTPQLSDATVNGELLGFFDGDEEAGSVFGDPAATRGRSIAVMKFTTSEGATMPKFILVDKVYEQMNDGQLIGTFQWSDISAEQNNYAFIVCNWNVNYTSFMYAKDAKGIEGEVGRLPIGSLRKKNAGTMEELHKLLEEASQGAGSRTLYKPNKQLIVKAAESDETAPVKVPYRLPEQRIETPWQPVAMPIALGSDIYLPVAKPVKK